LKLTDGLAKLLQDNGVRCVFGVQGGAVVHIFDSLERLGVRVIYTHHEVSAALAAAAYSKATGSLGCVVVTTGPGATNAITGLLGAWQDSVPCVFISGQVRSQHTSYGKKVRQVGTQEVPICDLVSPITKVALVAANPESFLRDAQNAIDTCQSMRPGPVWLDLPLDYQWANVAVPEPPHSSSISRTGVLDLKAAEEALSLMETATRPLLVIGNGSRMSGNLIELQRFVESKELYFVTTWSGADIFASDHPLNLGQIGMSGQRGANKAVFEADLLLCLGTHLAIPHTTTLFDTWAPQAKKIVVNIDSDQLDNLNVEVDVCVKADVSTFLTWLDGRGFSLNQGIPNADDLRDSNWYVPEQDERINSNIFIRELTTRAPNDSCLVVDGGGTALYAAFQSSIIKKEARIICSTTMSSMGTGLAETVGVAAAGISSTLICIIGDGSLMMNMQDLQSIRQHCDNAIICVINNNGYLAIRNTQREFLDGRMFGTHPDWGLTFPSIQKVASAFEIPYVRLEKPDDVSFTVDFLLAHEGPVICEIIVDEEQGVLFRQGFVRNLDGTSTPQPLSSMLPTE
jgi:acetolactate synthase I/II/III large subunit